MFKRLLKRLAAKGAHALRRSDGWEEMLLLQGAHAAMTVRQIDRLQTLGDAEFKVFSQFGEDGIIEWLVAHLPGIPHSFVEFGVEEYWESNTRFLLRTRHWRGLVMDGSAENVAKIRGASKFWEDDLTAVNAFIDTENINGLIANNGFTGDIGILSIDIDGNDYWVWEAISVVKPWIVIVEYNAVFGDLLPLTILQGQPEFMRSKAHFSNLYLGASTEALRRLGTAKGYSLIGSNRAGDNAFFVRNDLMPHLADRIVDTRPLPSMYREGRSPDGSLSLATGAARRDVIGHLNVHNLATGDIRPLKDMGDLYSEHWRAIIGMK